MESKRGYLMWDQDGHCRNPLIGDLVPGTILREIRTHIGSHNVPPFGDSLIVSVNNGYCKLVRPYVRASVLGSIYNWTSGFEQYEVSVDRLLNHDCHLKVVLMSTGEPASYLETP